MPVSVTSGFAFVEAYINGQGPFRLLVDTGSGTSLLTSQAARKAGLEPTFRVELVTAAGEKLVPGGRASLRVGDTQFPDLEINICELPAVRRLDTRADGVLGNNFLRRQPWLLDYRARTLKFGDDALAAAERLGSPQAVADSHGRPIVSVQVDAQATPWKMVLDSGASSLLLWCQERCPRLMELGTGAIHTFSGAGEAESGLLRTLRVGEHWFARRQTVTMSRASEVRGEDGLLPANLFSAVFVDMSQEVARFRR